MTQQDKQKEIGRPGLAFHERNLRISILSLLRMEGEMPRALLSEKLQTTPAMMTRCIQRLQAEELVHNGGKSKGSGGRMCTNVALNPNAGVLIGVEYNRHEIVTVAVNFACCLEKQSSFPVPEKARDGSPDEMLSAVFKAIRETFSSIAKSRPLLGIAAVDPGVINTLTGVTISSNALPKWRQVPVRQKLSDEFRVPVYLSNTTNAILAAVDRHELARRYNNFFYLEYRDGVSCALKSNGSPVLGARGMTGELTLAGSDKSCDPPPIYLEYSLGFSAIRRRLHEEGHPAFQNEMPRADMIEAILSRAAQGDAQVKQIVKETWHQLGQACGNLANLLDPEAIVLDPHFGRADSDSLAAFKQGLRKQRVASQPDPVEIIVSELKEPAAPIGAALTLLDDLTFNYKFI